MSRIRVLAMTIALFIAFLVFTEPTDKALTETATADNTERILADEETAESETQGVEAEEYTVYSALIQEMFFIDRGEGSITYLLSIKPDIGRIVIAEATEPYTGQLSQAKQIFGKELIFDFLAKNARSYRLRNRFSLDVVCVVLSSKEAKELSKNGDYWNNFHEKYPRSQGVTAFSRVGFNANRTEALLYIGTQSDWLAGRGYYVQLSRQNEQWTIKKKLDLWVS